MESLSTYFGSKMKTSSCIIINIVHHHFQDVIRVIIFIIIKLFWNTKLGLLFLIIISKEPVFFPVCSKQ